MKKNLLYLAALAVTLGLASCSSDDYAGDDKQPTIDPVANVMDLAPAKKSEVKFWSNTQNLAEEAVVKSEIGTANVPFSSYQQQQQVANARLGEGVNNKDKIDTDFMFYAKDNDVELNLYLLSFNTDQQRELGVFYYDETGEINEVPVWSFDWNSINYYGDNVKSVKITVKKGYKFGFYWNGKDNTGQPTKYYSKSSLNANLPIHSNPNETSSLHAGTFTDGGNTYLCIEDWVDFDFQDAVLATDIALTTVDGDDTTPTTPEVKPDPTPDPEEPVVPVDPVDPVVSDKGGSVEVNLAINAPHDTGDWKESHLSIHVRDTTDVTVFLPVQAEYYCSQDDMMIVQKHDVAWQYNETSEEVSMVVGGQVVTLNITYAENGITVTTKGVTADVLKYCRDNYNDGITFEIRNYYNNEITREDLIAALSNSTVTFLDKAPNVYVNAYGMWEGVVDPYACKVLPADKDNRNEPSTEMSMNNESTLYIYPLKNIE